MKTTGPIYKPTASSAIEFSNVNRLEEWIHLFLCNEGDNKAFSDGLKLEPRCYYAPRMMNLDEFERCCGPEINIKFQIPKAGFNQRVDNISEKYSSGDWDMPPLIIYLDENGYELSDGNHRYEALKRLGHKQYWVIIWEKVICGGRMLEYKIITLGDVKDLAEMYVETFNSEPWNDRWTIDTASKRLHQMINVEGFFGILARRNDMLCGMILGSKEQYFDGIMFNIKEFCVKNEMRGKGLGTEIYKEFEMRIKEEGIREIILFTSKGDYTEHFYHKQGLETYNDLTLMGKQL